MGHRTDQHLEHAEHTQHHAQDPFDRKVAMSMAVIAMRLSMGRSGSWMKDVSFI